jgi:hypothetical protein
LIFILYRPAALRAVSRRAVLVVAILGAARRG